MSTRELRPYQTAALQSVLNGLEGGQNRLLWKMPTGTGKTFTFANLPIVLEPWLQQFPERDRKMLVIAHREELLDQAAATISATNPSLFVMVEQADRHASPFADVIVASVQTLAARNYARLKKLLASFTPRVVVVDECHHSAASTYRTTLAHMEFLPKADISDDQNIEAATHDDVEVMTRALAGWDREAPKDRLLLGVTATPNRSDAVGLSCVFQSIAFSYDLKQAIADGWLVPIVSWSIETKTSLDAVRTTAGEFNQKDLAKAVNNAMRNELGLSAWRAHAEGVPTLGFTVDVAHAHTCKDLWRGAGYRAEAVSGETPKDDRRNLLRQFQDGQIDVLFNCFDDETEILTLDGWRKGDEVAVGDVVAAVDPQVGDVRWENVLDVVRREKADDERMVSVFNQTLNVRMTEDHRALWRPKGSPHWRITKASDLCYQTQPYELRVAGSYQHFSGVSLSDIELEFLGLFITDGHLNRERATIEIVQSASSPMCDEIERILTGCHFDWKVSESKGVTPAGETRRYLRYRIPKGNIGGLLARNGWSRLEAWLDKSISPDLGVCTRAQFERLLHGLWIGDGYKSHHRDRERPSIEVCSADPVFVDRLQAMAVVRGFACSSSWYPNNRSGLGSDDGVLAVVRVRDRVTVCTNNQGVPTSGGNPARLEQGVKGESVWCVRNSTGTVIVRRRGRVSVMGQCMVLTEGTDLPRTGCILHLKPTKSASLYEQMTGRGLRLFQGKDHCIVIDLVDLARKHSLQASPMLYGLPTSVLVKGKKLDEQADEFDELMESLNGVSIEDMLKAGRMTLEQLGALAKRVDVFWQPRPLGAFGEGRIVKWISVDDSHYQVSYPWSDGHETVEIVADLVGKWDVTTTVKPSDPSAPKRQKTIAMGCATAVEAAEKAEAFIENKRRSVLKLKAAAAPWMSKEASPAQIGFLKKLGVSSVPRGLTSGQASEWIDRIKANRGMR